VAQERSPFELAREAIDLAERHAAIRPPVKTSVDADELRWLGRSHDRFLHKVSQLSRLGWLHSDVARGMRISEPHFSKLFNRGFERSNQIVAKHLEALDELIASAELGAVRCG
jgi:DNA-binding GntR family transcriptional regulator